MQRVVAILKIRGETRQWLTSMESAAQADKAEAKSASEAIQIKAAASSNGEGNGSSERKGSRWMDIGGSCVQVKMEFRSVPII